MQRKKVTRATLAELAQKKEIIAFEMQKTFVGCGDGTYGNPFTFDEFQRFGGGSNIYYYNESGELCCNLPEITVTGGTSTAYSGDMSYTGGTAYQGGSNKFTGEYYYYNQGGEIRCDLEDVTVVVGGSQTKDDTLNSNGSSNSVGVDIIDLMNRLNDVTSSVSAGLENTGQTRIGSNYKVYFASSKGVFYGNQYVSTGSLVKIGGKIGRITGVVGVTLGAGQVAYAVYEDGGEFGEKAKEATGKFVGGSVGAVSGAWAGGKTGTFIGLLIAGPVGAAVGGFIGGSIGGIVGGIIGENIGKDTFNTSE
ncbi:hypothetical protein [Bacteroides pyogenes]|uniref:hypothetical protein n=1 Tax=Bacteroides pyogenes TaxID=310300 RepID=UPI001BA6F480|nr:hypothetical protein [Bacteroides pyogenes]MBR8726680.1 hypothetical protein [Bacteroides pyogenes]MBR8740089.1 hypothetical protein [Bacteroides pyogenes]MBR8755843.1 hypothetical protein [Bacteroides pyogenes]MBR8797132.1 hypothetical protein [Bacteroides pyogenes]MBR8810766.1 hypothetical protein [Bacteroides pyogenes]